MGWDAIVHAIYFPAGKMHSMSSTLTSMYLHIKHTDDYRQNMLQPVHEMHVACTLMMV